jgi:hypothetical protein
LTNKNNKFPPIFDLLKKAITLSFLFIFLSANTELHQLFRLPSFVHHFLEHLKTDHKQSFANFLNDHYTNHKNNSDTDHHDHDNLPFKAADCSATHVSVVFVNLFQFSITRPNTVPDKVTASYNEVTYASTVVNNIWQPPKIS